MLIVIKAKLISISTNLGTARLLVMLYVQISMAVLGALILFLPEIPELLVESGMVIFSVLSLLTRLITSIDTPLMCDSVSSHGLPGIPYDLTGSMSTGHSVLVRMHNHLLTDNPELAK